MSRYLHRMLALAFFTYLRSEAWGEGVNTLIIYYEACNEKSFPDSKHLVHPCTIKLMKINIKNPAI